MVRPKTDHTNTTCCICGRKDTYIRPYGKVEWMKYKKNGTWNHKSYVCYWCYGDLYRKRPDSNNNIIKYLANSRIGNVDRFENRGKGIIGQWIGGKTLGLKDLNIENNNFNEPIDLSWHSIYHNIDVKIATYNNVNDQWRFENIRHSYDNLLALCMDRYKLWKNVEIAYMIPISQTDTTSITIFKNLSKGGKYEKFRIDEKPYNDMYHSVDIPELFGPFDVWNGKYDL